MFCRHEKVHEHGLSDNHNFKRVLKECGVGSPLFVSHITVFLLRHLCPDRRSEITMIRRSCWTPTDIFFNPLLHSLCQRSPNLARGPDPARVRFQSGPRVFLELFSILTISCKLFWMWLSKQHLLELRMLYSKALETKTN